MQEGGEGPVREYGGAVAGSQETAEVPVSMVLLFSPAVGTARKWRWMTKSALAVDWPAGTASGRAILPISPFYWGQEASSEGVAK